jgi:hypothetical protein
LWTKAKLLKANIKLDIPMQKTISFGQANSIPNETRQADQARQRSPTARIGVSRPLTISGWVEADLAVAGGAMTKVIG